MPAAPLAAHGLSADDMAAFVSDADRLLDELGLLDETEAGQGSAASKSEAGAVAAMAAAEQQEQDQARAQSDVGEEDDDGGGLLDAFDDDDDDDGGGGGGESAELALEAVYEQPAAAGVEVAEPNQVPQASFVFQGGYSAEAAAAAAEAAAREPAADGSAAAAVVGSAGPAAGPVLGAGAAEFDDEFGDGLLESLLVDMGAEDDTVVGGKALGFGAKEGGRRPGVRFQPGAASARPPAAGGSGGILRRPAAKVLAGGVAPLSGPDAIAARRNENIEASSRLRLQQGSRKLAVAEVGRLQVCVCLAMHRLQETWEVGC